MARRNVFLMLGGGGVLAAALVFWLASEPPSRAADAAPPQAVPITAQVAKAEDVPVLLRGLGNVTAFATVQIKAQVNGTLVAVPVREGQEVRRGDILAEIDPRPYQAALD